MTPIKLLLPALALLTAGLAATHFDEEKWQQIETKGKPSARHEATFMKLGDKCYLLGGRRIQPVDEFDPATKSWRALAKPPLELHHFQAVDFEGKIWIIGALTGRYPNETPVPNIHIFNPATNTWTLGPEIPKERRRGGSGTVVHDGKIYVVCGIQRGHQGGYVPWLDSFDPATGKWQILPDAPRPRDHFQAVLINDQIIAAAGRTTSNETKQVFSLTIPEADIYDIATAKWTTAAQPIPTPRAGTLAIAIDGQAIIAGGESDRPLAHHEVEALDPKTGTWESWPPLSTARHGTGLALVDGMLYTASGCCKRGGSAEVNTTEALQLPKKSAAQESP